MLLYSIATYYENYNLKNEDNMKKIMFMFSILLAVVACSKDEVVTKPKIDVSTPSIEVYSDAATNEVTVTSNQKWTVSSSAAEWCIVTPASGANNGIIKVEVKANESIIEREASITIKGGELEKVVTVKQKAVSREAFLSGTEWRIVSQDGEDRFDVIEGAAIHLNADKTALIDEMTITIQEGAPEINEIAGVWSINEDNNIHVVSNVLGLQLR